MPKNKEIGIDNLVKMPEGKNSQILRVVNYLLKNTKNIDKEYTEIANKNFWDLIKY